MSWRYWTAASAFYSSGVCDPSCHLTQHPNYRYTADCDPRNTFNIEAFLSHKLTLKPEDVYEVVDVDESA